MEAKDLKVQTLDVWRDLGYCLKRGSRPMGYDKHGWALFDYSQVRKKKLLGRRLFSSEGRPLKSQGISSPLLEEVERQLDSTIGLKGGLFDRDFQEWDDEED